MNDDSPQSVEAGRSVWAALRILVGSIFLWSFFDKLFGLGFNTAADASWLAGVSPTFGFLKFATKGPLGSLYQGMAGSALVDWLFMLGLLCVGVALLFGIFVKIASGAGMAMLAMMYTAGFMPPAHNPVIDEHIIYITILIGLASTGSGRCFGLGDKWSSTALVRKFPMLE